MQMIDRISKFGALLACVGSLCAAACGPATDGLETDGLETSDVENASASSDYLDPSEIEIDPRFQELALFIAGRDPGADSQFAPLTATASYQSYRKRVRGAWARYEENHLSAMRSWNTTLQDRGCGPHVFYPFSGPDITHAVSLFPRAPTYALFGLEPVGPIPAPRPQDGAAAGQRLGAVLDAVGDVLGRNFFKTIDMAVDVGQNEYSGVAGLLLFFLGNLEYEVLGGHLSEIGADGRVRAYRSADALPVKQGDAPSAKAAASGSGATGVTYYFRKAGGPIQQVTYFSINLVDGAYGENVKNFLKARRASATMLKAASYLMYRPSFDGVRATILGGSNCILTDSSGVPFHYLNNGRWKLDLFGVYLRPVPLFRSRFQPDLFIAFQNKHRAAAQAEDAAAGAPALLPFSYGYNSGPGKSHLIFAVRDLARNPWFTPVFDDNTTIGDDTAWHEGKRTLLYERRFTAADIALRDGAADESRPGRPAAEGPAKKQK